MKKTLILSLISLVLFSGLIVSCADVSDNGYAQKEEKLVALNQSILLNAQPPVKLSWSLEREQINLRTNLWNNKNKIAYIYLMDMGRIISFHAIKGKVSSVNSQITNPEKLQRFGHTGNRIKGVTLPSPAEDGSYGTNGDAIFFFTQEGVYVEWNGKYFLSDQPMKLSQKPLLYKEIKESK